ncbi:Isoquinoline 1-oxidoreductase subunit [Bradyrhizobium sp. McL0616]|uniref:Isoquinoline 1-oxidoreductase subunit n=1 Tax=Bradyrhizobium sp. McL0616 TaxID=3415674 RepID=UPI003CEB56F1
MRSDARFKMIVVIAALAGSLSAGYAASQTPSNALAAPESFASIGDTEKRSAAIFTELGKVLTHPRCTNCHPAGDTPHQGDNARLHQPPVARGVDGHGLEAMRCNSCHQQANFEPGRMPGHPDWHLAPREMAWEGKTIGEICEQIRDPGRNGGRKVEDLIDHIGKDTLVGWAWKPGFGRSPAPGTQEQAGALVEAWVKTGAACPAP